MAKKSVERKKISKAENSMGSLSFLFGSLIAVVAGAYNASTPSVTITSLLIVLGIIVGLINVTIKETNSFLLAAVSLVIVSALGGAVLGQVALIGQYLEGILRSILTFVVPSTIIVALKSIQSVAKN